MKNSELKKLRAEGIPDTKPELIRLIMELDTTANEWVYNQLRVKALRKIVAQKLEELLGKSGQRLRKEISA